MCLLVTLVLLVAVMVDGASAKSLVTSSPNSASTSESTVQVNQSSTDTGLDDVDEVQNNTQEMNISIDLTNSTGYGNHEALSKLSTNYEVNIEEQITNINESKSNIRKTKRKQIKKLRKYIATVPYIVKRINSSDTAKNSNGTTSKRILMIPKTVMRNLVSKYKQYQKIVSEVPETQNETLKMDIFNENSTNYDENKNSSNLLVNFLRFFESDNSVSRKKIQDDDEDDENDDNDDDDEIDEIMKTIQNKEQDKPEEGYYDISDFIIDMLGGAAAEPDHNDWSFDPQNDLESRSEFPYEGITNFNDAKHTLTSDVVQNHINSPTFDANTEQQGSVDLAENLENGKMENLLWKDFFSFEIPDKVTKKPKFVPGVVNNSQRPYKTVVKKTSGTDGAYASEEDESWESDEDYMYDYPDEAYTDYVDEYDVNPPMPTKVKSNVNLAVKANTDYSSITSVIGKNIYHNAKQRNRVIKPRDDYIDESNEKPIVSIWNDNRNIKTYGKPFKSTIKEAFQTSNKNNVNNYDGDYSEEYEVHSKIGPLLPHLQKQRAVRLEQKKAAMMRGRGLFTHKKMSSSEIEGDDDSISTNIDREETYKVPLAFRHFVQNKNVGGSSALYSEENSSESLESSSEEKFSASGEFGKISFRHFDDSSSSSESSGSFSDERSSYSSENLGSSSEESFSSSSEDNSSHNSDESAHGRIHRKKILNKSSDSNSNEYSYSSEKSLSLSDENYSLEDYSLESTKEKSNENIHPHYWMHRRKPYDSSQSFSDYVSSESFSDEVFSSSDEDYYSSSSEEHVPVINENPRFEHIHQPKNAPVNHYYTFFKTQDWKRLDENRYVEESRRYHKEHYDDDNGHETTTIAPPVQQHIPTIPPPVKQHIPTIPPPVQQHIPTVPPPVQHIPTIPPPLPQHIPTIPPPKTPPKPFVLLQRTAIVRTTMPPPPTPFVPVPTPPLTTPPPPAPPVFHFVRNFVPKTTPPPPPTPPPVQIFRNFIPRSTPAPPPPQTPPPPPVPPVVQRINILRTHIPTPAPPAPPKPQPTPTFQIIRTKYTPFVPNPTPPPPPPQPPRPQPIPRVQLFRPQPKPQPRVPNPTPKPNLMQWYLPMLYQTLQKFGKSQKPPPPPKQVKKSNPYDALQNEIMNIDLQKAWTNSYQKNSKKNSYKKNSYDKDNTYAGGYRNAYDTKSSYGGYGRTYSQNRNNNLSYGKYGYQQQTKRSNGSYDNPYFFNPYNRMNSSGYSSGYGKRWGYGNSHNVYPKTYSFHASMRQNSKPIHLPTYNRSRSQIGYGLGFNGIYPLSKTRRY